MVPYPEEGEARGAQADDSNQGENSVKPIGVAAGGAVEAVGEGYSIDGKGATEGPDAVQQDAQPHCSLQHRRHRQ